MACFCKATSADDIIDDVCSSVIAAKVFPMTLFFVPIARSAFTSIGFDFSVLGSFVFSASFIDFPRGFFSQPCSQPSLYVCLSLPLRLRPSLILRLCALRVPGYVLAVSEV